ncbi:sigma-70 family RNA polymerase sigma factor [Actinomadura sp. SCN-SB]|uniref:sigma-70 family RNA polymerase sigma factor n=1 Tax=Actinomadura sp. SCN-SB TaxID=3373092 RepID=UPI0037528220
MVDQTEFARLANPYRGELLAHCYRMLGSVHDAEDLVQETYLRAWRSFDGFEGRTSLRRWLYRIATNRCLTALERAARRPLPSGLSRPAEDADVPVTPGEPGMPWLEPVPDALLRPGGSRVIGARVPSGPDDPAAIVTGRGSVRLALVAAMQHLPARQRAVLILRDVLDWRAAEVADLLGTTTAAVNSLLQRARARIEEAAVAEDEVSEPDDPARRAVLDRYVAAFHDADMAGLSRLLRDDAILEMPPSPTWFRGREAVMRFLSSQCADGFGGKRLIPTAANGQPAAAVYIRGADGAYRAHSIQVLTLSTREQDGTYEIARIVAFLDTRLFALFGLPGALPAEAVP